PCVTDRYNHKQLFTHGLESPQHIAFFFSSRRRHTRWPRDWSSDVCFPILSAAQPVVTTVRGMPPVVDSSNLYSETAAGHLSPSRSEERRVGKECRSRWSTRH